VAADMIGLALRTYRRKIQRLTESETLSGRSLWEAVHDFIGAQLSLPATKLDASVARLLETGRVVIADGGEETRYRAPSFVLPLGTSKGWEAAIFDHFQAVVNTICHKLRHDPGSAGKGDRVGGSTYSLEVWPGHPLEEEATGALKHLREYLGDLRRRIAAHNAASNLPAKRMRVVAYAGQFIIDREETTDVAGEEDDSE
jgi:hypothetical protein